MRVENKNKAFALDSIGHSHNSVLWLWWIKIASNFVTLIDFGLWIDIQYGPTYHSLHFKNLNLNENQYYSHFTYQVIFVTTFQVNFTIYILLWDFGLYFEVCMTTTLLPRISKHGAVLFDKASNVCSE